MDHEKRLLPVLDTDVSDSQSEPSIFKDNSEDDPTFTLSEEENPFTSVASTSIVNTPSDIQDQLLRPRNVRQSGKRPRKKIGNPSGWKKYKKKRLREQGKEYQNGTGKSMPARVLKPASCGVTCPYNCTANFSEPRRRCIHEEFWALTDDEKRFYYSKFIEKLPTKRKRTLSQNSRRGNSFKYSFEIEGQNFQVCKSFFLATLDVSQRRIYYFFENNYNNSTGSPKPSTKGKHVKRQTPVQKEEEVKRHIEKFPCVDPHYVRSSTERQYLEAGLNITKMYKLYEAETPDPVTYAIYRKIFNTQYNLSFYIPKKDQCDFCTKHQNDTLNESEKTLYERHLAWNEMAKVRRNEDRINTDPNTAIVLYDLQNVFSLPHASASNFFYKRKFHMYNLTGYCNLNKITYCSIWNETGRTGNDIASALIKILNNVLADNPQITSIILWSDSCIPQNRNRITSFAILKFMEKNKQIKKISQRFSESGHSRIQELDAVHSVIERHLRNISYHSPVSLLRALKSMDYDNVKLKLMQCDTKDFFNYNLASTGLNFIPYASCKEIEYNSANLLRIQYRKDYGDNAELNTVPLFAATGRKKRVDQKELPKNVHNITVRPIISKEKVKDISSMLKFMPPEDANYFKVLLKIKY